MKRVIHYMLSHPPHGPYLVVSLNSLRRWCDYPVILHGWEETGSYDIVSQIANDPRLGPIWARGRDPAFRGHGDYWVDKIDIMLEQRDVDSSLLLDADTIIVGKLDELFEAAEKYGYAVTQFCDWKTTNNIIKNRVKRLLVYPELNLDLINNCLEHAYPSPNVGIFSCVPDTPVLHEWRRWSYIARDVFIADESVMQALLPKYVREGKAAVIDGRFNCSTMRFQHIPDNEVVIWHGHGNSFLRPEKSPKGHAMWWEQYQAALERNLGNIRDWVNKYDNKRMGKCLKERKNLGLDQDVT